MGNSWVARVMVAGGIKFSHAVIKISLDAGESAAGSDEVTISPALPICSRLCLILVLQHCFVPIVNVRTADRVR